jgi:hypothetical protein
MAVSNPGIHSWPQLLAQWRLSGLTQAEFCARHGLSLPAFRYHLYKPQRRSGSTGRIAPTAAAQTTPLFLPVVCSSASQPDHASSAAASLEIILDDGLRIAVAPGFDPQTLRRLVEALRQPPC